MAPRFGWLALVGCAALVVGCHDDESVASSGAPECAPGEWLGDDRVCVAPGLPPDMPCPPGEWLRDDSTCIPAGVPPDGCGEGFVHDGDRGCEPILPADSCSDGLMAVPGETRCREVAPCAPGTFGGIPVEPNTEYVDASYTGGASDGSQAAPWTSIQDGIDAALDGAIVAVAAGSYVEDVIIQGKPVRLWGKCPALVELSGSGAQLGAIEILTSASGTEVHRMGVTGQADGIALSGSENVLVDESWIHDNADRGVDAEDVLGATSLVVKGSLLERNRPVGIFIAGSGATLERVAVRETLPDAQGFGGRGISVADSQVTGARANVIVTSSLVEQNHEIGVRVGGSDATVDTTVVRDTLPDAQPDSGRGMSIQHDAATGARASVIVTSSLFERNQRSCILVTSSDATVDRTVVRDNLPDTQGLGGRGMTIQDDQATGARASVLVTSSLLERNHDLGILVGGSDATVERSVVRDTSPDAQGLHGGGIGIQEDTATGARGSAVVTSSLLERNHEIGVLVSGSDATIDSTVVRDTLPATDRFGSSRAIQVQDGDSGAAASATLRASLLERSVEVGIFVTGPASAEIDACLMRDTAARSDGLFGDGLVVWSYNGPASAAVTATRIEETARAAVASFGATVAIGSSLLVCQPFDISAEPWQGQPPVLDDQGGVFCGCPEATGPCVARSHALEPPAPVGE